MNIDPSALRITGPAELLDAVPRLLGFHPADSLVVIGLHDGRLVVTARMDLADAVDQQRLVDTLTAMSRGGTTQIVGVIYPARDAECHDLGSEGVAQLQELAKEQGLEVADVFTVTGTRWRSELCTDPSCCPPGGNELPNGPTVFTTASVVAGVVVAPTREAMAERFNRPPGQADLRALITTAEHAATAAVLEGRSDRWERSAKRAIFAAALTARKSVYPADADAARFAEALRNIAVRDHYWLQIDDRGFDGNALWLNLAQRAPSPYAAAPLFLYGWAAWRAGNGALAGMAAERAQRADPDYSAAALLLEVLTHGVNPRRFPTLQPTTATGHTTA